MRARKLIKTAVAELKASEAIDHWQKGRERIEAEDLLAFVMGGDEPDPDARIGNAERDVFEGLIARRATGDVFGGLPKTIAGTVDVITAHPPYVAMHEVDDLPDEIKDWEPVHTLTDRSSDGLGFVRQTVAEAPAWLRPKGWLLLETDPDRARDVKNVMVDGGFRDVRS